MADKDRVVYPDELAAEKAAAGEVKPENGDSNSVEEPAPEVEAPKITLRNMITVPPNCPPGHQMGADGVCREVFD